VLWCLVTLTSNPNLNFKPNPNLNQVGSEGRVRDIRRSKASGVVFGNGGRSNTVMSSWSDPETVSGSRAVEESGSEGNKNTVAEALSRLRGDR
jgi:hypothetical protein